MKKAKIILTVAASIFVVAACQNKSDDNSSKASNPTELPEDYMYTLTIPEIMDIPISDPV
ncbi:MAG: hypothetical protein AAF149_23530 [Bacteroidota bacterium]